MIDPALAPLVIPAASFILALCGGVIGTSVRVGIAVGKHDGKISKQIGDLKEAIVDLINKHEMTDQLRFAAVDVKIDEATDTITQQFGDTGKALREQLHKQELEQEKQNSKNLELFMRRTSFYEVTKEMGNDLKELVTKVDDLRTQIAGVSHRRA